LHAINTIQYFQRPFTLGYDLNMKGMKGIQSVPSFIQMDDPKNGVFMCTKKLTDPFHKKYCFIFPAN